MAPVDQTLPVKKATEPPEEITSEVFTITAIYSS
jgi:hypothetical protein